MRPLFEFLAVVASLILGAFFTVFGAIYGEKLKSPTLVISGASIISFPAATQMIIFVYLDWDPDFDNFSIALVQLLFCIGFVISLVLTIVGLALGLDSLVCASFTSVAFFPLCIMVLGFLDLEGIITWIKRRFVRTRLNPTPMTRPIIRPEPREPPKARIPVYLHQKSETGEEGPICAICKEELKKGEKMKRMPICLHDFHAICIDRWLENKMTCPICRCRVDAEIKSFSEITIE